MEPTLLSLWKTVELQSIFLLSLDCLQPQNGLRMTPALPPPPFPPFSVDCGWQ